MGLEVGRRAAQKPSGDLGGWGVKRDEVPPPRASQLNDPLERHKNKAPVPDEGGKGSKN